MLSLVPELLVNIAHIGKLTRRIQTLADSNGQYRLRRHWRVRKDEKALAARSGVDDSLRGRRGGDADRRLLLAVLDGRVTAYSKQATAKRTRAAGTQRLSRCVAMWCDAQRRVVERCDAPRRAALPTVCRQVLRVPSTNPTWLVAWQLQDSAAVVAATFSNRAEEGYWIAVPPYWPRTLPDRDPTRRSPPMTAARSCRNDARAARDARLPADHPVRRRCSILPTMRTCSCGATWHKVPVAKPPFKDVS
jgi:hypothetical protein